MERGNKSNPSQRENEPVTQTRLDYSIIKWLFISLPVYGTLAIIIRLSFTDTLSYQFLLLYIALLFIATGIMGAVFQMVRKNNLKVGAVYIILLFEILFTLPSIIVEDEVSIVRSLYYFSIPTLISSLSLDKKYTLSLIGFNFIFILLHPIFSILSYEEILGPLVFFIVFSPFLLGVTIYRDRLENENISRQVNLEKLRQQSLRMDTIGQFSSGISHDFNNLLTIILGYSELIMDQNQEGLLNPEELDEYSREIISAAKRGKLLTDQIKSFSKDQALKKEYIEVNGYIRESIPLIARLLGERIELQLNLCSRQIFVEINPGQLNQILLNLVSNASDAISENGSIRISTRYTQNIDENFLSAQSTPGFVILDIKDDGEGIPENILSHIFDPFYSTKEKGSGLGLTTVQNIVANNGGAIFAESEVGSGSRFSIFLPLSPLSPINKPHLTSVKNTEHTGNIRKILLVEDDPHVQKSLTTGLSAEGFSLLTAENGLEGLKMFKEHRDAIDLVITDVVMPKMSGPEMLSKILDIQGDVRAILISGYSEDHGLGYDPRFEHFEYMEKPVSISTLVEVINS